MHCSTQGSKGFEPQNRTTSTMKLISLVPPESGHLHPAFKANKSFTYGIMNARESKPSSPTWQKRFRSKFPVKEEEKIGFGARDLKGLPIDFMLKRRSHLQVWNQKKEEHIQKTLPSLRLQGPKVTISYSGMRG